MLQSQIPAAAARYFEQRRVDTAEFHPVVSAIFRPQTGWTPVAPGDRHEVSHRYLVRLRDAKRVTAVQLTAGRSTPDFTMEELVGKATALDAEFADGIPVSERSGVVLARGPMAGLLTELGFGLDDAYDALDRADQAPLEFIVRKCDSMLPQRVIEGWRYRLVARSQIIGGGPGYELSVLVHEVPEA